MPWRSIVSHQVYGDRQKIQKHPTPSLTVYKTAQTKTNQKIQPSNALCAGSGLCPEKRVPLLPIGLSECDIKTTTNGPTNGFQQGGPNGDS